MRFGPIMLGVCAVLVCGCTSTPKSQAANVATSTLLILEKNEGERRVLRGWPGHPDPGETFTIKVDPKNGGSSHLVFFTGDIAPGEAIHAHRHLGADEILFLQSGTARVHLGDSARDIYAGSIVFIPANTWISVDNIGSDNISMVTVFSARASRSLCGPDPFAKERKMSR